ncbi:DUF4961 domain-containing protein [Chitinophaga horti]|uniref:DUF4961 domain-containing protein n=1 Tax=Chitinophaga horti TaxID=2920382 RepID=A0ABY6J506_9BACT|nr:DUF4961 domain-containing protein [Chitinophaga horti]UYQ94441.1 DUF4961 domain-containing protein [Chitinophaga horti]
MKRYAYALLLLLALMAGCVFLEGVDEPTGAQAGTDLTFTMRTRIDVADGGRSNVRLIIGFLAPKSWEATANSTITYTTTSFGSGKMVPVPASVIADKGQPWPAALKARFGMGGNYMVDDLEWVVFWTEQTYNVAQGVKQNIDVKIVTKAGADGTRFKTGYFLGTSSENLSDVFGTNNVYKCQFKSCFEVSGPGDIIDFCNPQIGAAIPGQATDNDLITLSFDPQVVQTPLDAVSEIYCCAKAYTTDGQVLDACTANPASLLRPFTGKRSAVTIWPRAFFSVPDGKTLSKIEYFFTDATGSIRVGYANTASPFVFTFKCQ